MPRRSIVLLLILALPGVASSAGLVPLTGPVVIGEIPDREYSLYSPDVAALPGEFVVAWGIDLARYSGSQILDRGSGVNGRKVGADGLPVGGELALVPFERFTGKGAPRVAANAGDFAVTWASAGEDSRETTQNLRRFAPDGTARSAGLLLDHFPAIEPADSESAVALNAAGRAFAVWSHPRPSSRLGLLGQLFLPGDQPFAARFPVTLRAASQVHPDLALDGRGQAVLAYENVGPRGTPTVFLRLYDAAGRPRTVDIPLSPGAAAVRQSDPALAVHRSGRFVVAWQEGFAIKAQRFDPPLRPVGEPILVTAAGGPAGFPDVALDAQGRFLVTWLETDSQGQNPRVLGRGYGATGAPLGPAFRIDGVQGEGGGFYPSARPAVAAGAGGTFLVAWTDITFGASQVFSRLYAVR